MARQGVAIAQDDDFHTGTGDSYVHASQVAKEANLSIVVRAYQRDDDDIAFLSLESVNGIYTDACSEGFYPLFFTEL
jgi:hypothetical protein